LERKFSEWVDRNGVVKIKCWIKKENTMPWRLIIYPVINLGESFIDNVVRDAVQSPVEGSVVYCDLAFGYAEHSGIYIDENRIVHLNSKGVIEYVTPEEFIDGTPAMSVYVSCYDECPVGSCNASKRAEKKVGRSRDYNVILDNCHQFTAGCLTGDFENNCNFLWMLKEEAREELYANSWRVWEGINC